MTGTLASKLIYLVIIGGIVGMLAVASVNRLMALGRLRSGMEAAGQIIAKRIDRDDGTFYYVTYAFVDGAGVTRQREVQLRKRLFDSLASGERIRVRYQSDDPGNSYLGDPTFIQSHRAAMLGWLVLAAALASVAFAFVQFCLILDSCPAAD